MHIKNLNQLKQLKTQTGLSSRIASQLEAALNTEQFRPKTKRPGIPVAANQLADAVRELGSEGEEALSLALTREFGCWKSSGEVVRELMPFTGNRYRADFALPRYLISIEVQGWTHHGKSLEDHHSDRVREMMFAAHNWLVINVSHGQALNQHETIIETVRQAMSRRVPLQRDILTITEHRTPKNLWHRLSFVNSKAQDHSMPVVPY